MVLAGEPTFLFNTPVRRLVRFLGAIILLVQCFTMFYVFLNNYITYCCVMILALVMNAVLTFAVKKNKKIYLLIYMMYMVMGLVVLFGTFFGEIDFWVIYKKLCVDTTEGATHNPDCVNRNGNPGSSAFICLLVFCAISFSLDSFQLVFCWKLYNFLHKANTARDFHVSYYANEVNVPGAPPRYSPTTGETPANTTDPGPLPPKPPMYESLDVVHLEENRPRAASQPPTYQEQEPAPTTPEALMEL